MNDPQTDWSQFGPKHPSGRSPLDRLPEEEPPSRASDRKEVITLDEGDVVITFPESLTAESVNDLKDHLELFIKKIKRRTLISVASKSSGEAAN